MLVGLILPLELWLEVDSLWKGTLNLATWNQPWAEESQQLNGPHPNALFASLKFLVLGTGLFFKNRVCGPLRTRKS